MELNIKNYVDSINKNLKNGETLAKLFKTETMGYIYDTGTSKVLQCEDVEYLILEEGFNGELECAISNIVNNYGEKRVLEALENIISAIGNENILKSQKSGEFYSPDHFERLEDKVNSELEQISLELTEQCNLRCGYCIYNEEFDGKRNHGYKEMSEEVAKLAIDYIAEHGSSKRVAVTFYGGEPLIKFPLIKKCVEYSQEVIKNKTLTYSMTSNLLLMTPEIAKFLASVDGFSVVCSIDGPKHIHDSYRKDINGEGSFDRAIRGLKYLIEAFGEKAKNRIIINMVYAPPYYKGKAEEINDFYDSLDWLPKEIEKFSSYPEANSIPLKLIKEKYDEKGIDFEENHSNLELKKWAETNYIDFVKNNRKKDNFKREYFTKIMEEKSMLRIHKRPIFKESNGLYPFNGCCVPAARKLYICTDGKFMLCEKISGSESIGDVYSGLDISKIKEIFVDEYASKVKQLCSKCWAVRLCTICYAQCYTDKKLDLDKRNKCCDLIRQQIYEDLKLYHRCMEINPEGLEYINDIEVI